MQPGTIVTFFDKDKLTCGICLECKGNRLHLLSEQNRTLKLNLNRVIHHSEKPLNPDLSKDELLKQLKITILAAEHLMESLDTEELWQLLHDEGENFDLPALAELAFGAHPTSEQSAATLRALFADKIHFKFKNGVFAVHPPDKVEQILIKLQRDAEREEELQEGSTWLRKIWDGISVEDPPGKNRHMNLLRELAVLGSDAPEYQKGKELLKRAQINHTDAPFQLLVKLGEMREDENLLILRYGIPTDWSSETEREAEAINRSFNTQTISAMNTHRDMTALEVFTIDSETTRDVDDAVSVDISETSYQVGIHIADVAYHIVPGSQLDREASERMASIYLPEGTIPMFPPLLSEGMFSLTEGQHRLAISVMVDFDSSYEVKSFAITPSVVKVDRRYSYAQSNDLLNSNKSLSSLFEIARHLREKRLQAGALILPLPEMNVKVDESGTVQVSRRERETPSEVIISELMILTNWLCAGYLQERGVSLVYRVQPEPKELLEGAGGGELFINYRQRRLLSRMMLSTSPESHSSLGLTPYSTFTSPIRRYLDLVAQRQLCSALLNDRKPCSEEELKQLIVDTEMNQPKINLIQVQRQKYWLLKHLEGKVGEPLTGLVVRTWANRTELLLNDYLFETSIPSSPGNALTLGSTVTLKLEQVDSRSGLIRVALFPEKV
jgi:exoribonuclease-2